MQSGNREDEMSGSREAPACVPGRQAGVINAVRLGSCILFCSFLCFPILFKLFVASDPVAASEKRLRAPRPELAWRYVDQFPGAFEEYFNDHFPYRDTFIRWNSWVRYRSRKVISLRRDAVLIGQDGWFYFVTDARMAGTWGSGDLLEVSLRRLAERIEGWDRQLREEGIAYYFMLVPDKQTMYPEFLPVGCLLKPRSHEVAAYIEQHTAVKILHAAPSLFRKKGRHLLFRKHDTHWNEYGAFFAAQRLLRFIAQDFPGLTSPEEADLDVTYEDVTGGDLVKYLSLPEAFYVERVPRLAVRPRVPGAGSLRAVFFGDSFADMLKPFLQDRFLSFDLVAANALDMEVILRERPDVVIHEVNERFLDDLLLGDDSGKDPAREGAI